MENQIEVLDKNFVVSYSQEKLSLIKNANEIQIVDDETLGRANDLLQYAKNMKKNIDSKEKELTKPLNDTKQKIIDGFRPYKMEMDSVIDLLANKKIIPYQMALQKQIEDFKREEAERLRKEHEKASSEGQLVQAITIENKLAEIDEIKSDNKIESKFSNSSISMVWDFEIFDSKLVPAEYLMPDEKKIKEAVVKNGVRNIAGVRAFQRPKLTNRNA